MTIQTERLTLRPFVPWKRKSRLRYEFAVERSGERIGKVLVLLCKPYPHRGELAWDIDEAHRRRGYATEAAKAAMDFARRELGVWIFHATCSNENVASCKVAEKIGLLSQVNEAMPETWDKNMRYYQLVEKMIKTERLTLRPFTMRDLKTTHAYASDPEVARYMPVLHNQTKRGTKRFLLERVKQWKSGGRQERYDFAVLLDGVHIGSAAVTRRSDGRGELGWIISKAHWGRGYATEAAKAVLDFAQNTLGMTQIYARCDARNTASARVMEKIGLTLEDDTVTRRYEDSGEEVRELKYSINFRRTYNMKVIAAVGKNGTGKDFFLEYIAEKYGIPMVSIGDIVRELAAKDGLEQTRENLHKTSQKYMGQFGQTFFPEQIVKKIKEAGAPVYLVSGIRPLSDVQFLKEAFGAAFLLVDIVISDDEVRYGRMLARGSARDGTSVEQLRENDVNEEKIFRTSESEKIADITILNDGTAEDFYAAIETFYVEHVV